MTELSVIIILYIPLKIKTYGENLYLSVFKLVKKLAKADVYMYNYLDYL